MTLLGSMLAMTLLASPADGFGMPATEIQAKDWKNLEPTTLEAQTGKVVVLEFWATW